MAKKMINIRLDGDLWKQAKLDAVRQGLTLQDWLTLSIILRLDNSRVEMRENRDGTAESGRRDSRDGYCADNNYYFGSQ